MEDQSNVVSICSPSTGYAGDYYEWYKPYSIYDYYSYPIIISEDKGKKALEISKELIDKKLVNVRTAKQFVELMEIILGKL